MPSVDPDTLTAPPAIDVSKAARPSVEECEAIAEVQKHQWLPHLCPPSLTNNSLAPSSRGILSLHFVLFPFSLIPLFYSGLTMTDTADISEQPTFSRVHGKPFPTVSKKLVFMTYGLGTRPYP